MSDFFSSSPIDFVSKATVVTCILEFNHLILLLKRSERCIQPLKWCIPGGKLELNETPLNGLLRELQEELSITYIRKAKNFQEKMKLYVRHHLMDYILYVYYYPLLKLPKIKLCSREHTDFVWQPISQIFDLPLLEGQDEVLSMVLPFLLKKNL